MKNRDLMDLTSELSAVSMIITGLTNSLDEDCTKLSQKSLQQAMYGVASYLDRIVEDLDEL
ncbi:MAG: hypothetical protein SOU03_07980 [Dorea sp.]|nr:hypothetical protein [Dorea sp.]